MRRREVKWLEMLTQWDAYMLRNYRKVKVIITVIIVIKESIMDTTIITIMVITLTQWDAYMLRNYCKVIIFFIIIMINIITIVSIMVIVIMMAGARALQKRNPSEHKGEGLASPMWSKISGRDIFRMVTWRKITSGKN